MSLWGAAAGRGVWRFLFPTRKPSAQRLGRAAAAGCVCVWRFRFPTRKPSSQRLGGLRVVGVGVEIFGPY